MKIDVLVAEIGSTTTVVNAFNQMNSSSPCFIGQGQSATTVQIGDVRIGLQNAIDALKKNLGVTTLEYDKLFATSSAAGGLKMTVHGLVYDMTVKAASAAALGAGANLSFITAGKLRKSDLKKIILMKPNMILIAGGVDYGEYETALYNAEMIATLDIDVPILYAGNISNHEDVLDIFTEANKAHLLYIVDNVYPKLDVLNVEPTRKVIHNAFEAHIMHAPGMEHVFDMITDHIIPTPGAVLEMSKLLKAEIGDLVTIDVGGATTDVHSVTVGSEENSRILISPEPEAKRSVEGDLGMYVSRHIVAELMGYETLAKDLGVSIEECKELIDNQPPIPKTEIERKVAQRLCYEAVKVAMQRHAGIYRDIYSTAGKKVIAEGKDLTAVQFVIGTGGALIHLDKDQNILKSIPKMNTGDRMFPNENVKILIDHDYIMASLGVLSLEYPEQALALLKKSFRIETF